MSEARTLAPLQAVLAAGFLLVLSNASVPLHSVGLGAEPRAQLALDHGARMLSAPHPNELCGHLPNQRCCADTDHTEECDALVMLAKNTNFSTWTRKDNWMTQESFCTWQGIYCNNQSHVWLIQLHTNNLRGEIVSFDAFSKAKYISMHSNGLLGTLPSLERLPDLETLNVGNNSLAGTLPHLVGNPLLQSFKVWKNNFIGDVPSLANNKVLVDLFIQGNQFSGPVPPLSKNLLLREVYMQENQMTGTVPDLQQNTNLQFLRISANNLTGSVPDLSQLTALETLALHTNRLSGSLPPLSRLTLLDRLLLHTNELVGVVPELPPALMFADFSHNLFENFDDSICGHDLMLVHPQSNCLADHNPMFFCNEGGTGIAPLVRCKNGVAAAAGASNADNACHARCKVLFT